MAVSLFTVKAIAAAGTFFTSLCGFLVFVLKRFEKDTFALVIGYSNAFGSGVIISVGLLHMLAEAHEKLEKIYLKYPMSFLLAGIGFSIIYLCEDVLMGELILRYGQEMKNDGLASHVHSLSGNHNNHDCETGHLTCASRTACYGATNDTTQSNSAHPHFGTVASNMHNILQSTGDENSNRFGKSQAKKNKKVNLNVCISSKDAWEISVKSADILPTQHNKPSDLRTTLFALTLLGSISIHALFAGLGLGMVTSINSVWPIFTAIVLHKGVEAFVIGNAFMNSALKPVIVAILLVLFAAVTPIGIAIGLGISTTRTNVGLLGGSLVSISAGTFLYVGTLILKEEAQPDVHLPRLYNWYRFGLWLFGFVIMAVAAIWA